MVLSQLDNPVRVTWDLCGDSYRMANADVDIVLQRLVEAQPFFIALEQSPLNHDYCAAVLSKLAERGIRTTLFCSGQDSELENLAETEGFDLVMYLRLESFLEGGQVDFERLDRVVATIRGAGHNPGFCLTPLRSNIVYLPDLLEVAGDLDIPCFKLPNVRIDANFQQAKEGEILRPDNLEELRKLLPKIKPAIGATRLEIHDLFLWELLTPDSNESRSEYGGCQAANSLAHINHDATVFPCVSWPRSLGSLREQSFASIWSSVACQDVRDNISSVPAGCSGCCDYQICFGGCRGLAETFAIKGGLDPMCKGPR